MFKTRLRSKGAPREREALLRGFTLIELLVVIAIIGLLATLSVIALSNARAKSRDSKRLADIKQLQTSLALYYDQTDHYPTIDEFNSGSISATSSGNGKTTYMHIIPAAPVPNDGPCSASGNGYIYTPSADGSSYTLSFCIGSGSNNLAGGLKCATPGGILNIGCDGSGGNQGGGDQNGGGSCTPNYCLDNGYTCGSDTCGGSCGACTSPDVCASGSCCTPYCEDNGYNCGDNGCGGSCGSCASGQTCDNNQQCCVPQSDPDFCSNYSVECGGLTQTDNCGQERTVTCGSCGSGQMCNGGSCCTPQSDLDFCANYGAVCGSLTNTDNCGQTRTVASCGICDSSQICGGSGISNQCGCESDPVFCARLSFACGSLTNTDNCGQSRTVADCGSCTSPQTCGGGGTSGQCGCTPNCSGKDCGTDGCGGSCGTCTSPQTCGGGGALGQCGTSVCGFNIAVDSIAGHICNTGTPDYDTCTYGTVLIGTQCWLKQNMNIGKILIGSQTLDGVLEKYCYANNYSNCQIYGGLYRGDEAVQYSTAEGAQGICPDGWHVPTDAEQNILDQYLNDTTCNASRVATADCSNAGTKLKTGGTSGFDGLFAGVRTGTGSFYYQGSQTFFWSSTYNGGTPFFRQLTSSAGVYRSFTSQGFGHSVRCIRN